MSSFEQRPLNRIGRVHIRTMKGAVRSISAAAFVFVERMLNVRRNGTQISK